MNSTYTRSLGHILEYEDIIDFDDLKQKLDDNGYYSRHEIIQTNDAKNDRVKFKIEVYLEDSAMKYLWPYNNFYILNYGFEKHINRDPNYPIIRILRYILDNGISYPVNVCKKTSINYKTYIKNINILDKHKLIYRGQSVLKSHIDINEYMDNVING